MKKTAGILLFMLMTVLEGLAQQDSLSLPSYKRFPVVPPFKLLLTDGSSTFSKDDLSGKKATMVMLFSPDCEHCQHETEQIISRIGEFKNVEIVMASPIPIEKIRDFHTRYKLERFKNIIVGKDIYFILPSFYSARSLPFLAFYDKKGKLIDAVDGALSIDQILQKFKGK